MGMGVVICRRDEGRAIYFSAKPIPAATAFGSWSDLKEKALHFASTTDAIDFARIAFRSEEQYLSYEPGTR